MRIAEEEKEERRRRQDEEREARRQEREIRKLQMEAELQRQKVEIDEAQKRHELEMKCLELEQTHQGPGAQAPYIEDRVKAPKLPSFVDGKDDLGSISKFRKVKFPIVRKSYRKLKCNYSDEFGRLTLIIGMSGIRLPIDQSIGLPIEPNIR